MKYISTEGHGYLRVSKAQLNRAIGLGFKPSNWSFYNSKCALLEHDSDMGKYLAVMKFDGHKFSTVYQIDINRDLYDRF